MAYEIRLWRWQFTDPWGKRRTTRYLLTEKEALQRLPDAVKVEDSLEVHSLSGQEHFLPPE